MRLLKREPSPVSPIREDMDSYKRQLDCTSRGACLASAFINKEINARRVPRQRVAAPDTALGGLDDLVAHHRLYCVEIGTLLVLGTAQHVGGKGVA